MSDERPTDGPGERPGAVPERWPDDATERRIVEAVQNVRSYCHAGSPTDQLCDDVHTLIDRVRTLEAELARTQPAQPAAAVAGVVPQPTADDLARRADADLAVCDKATPPPWSRRDRHIGQDNYHADTEIQGNPISHFGKVVGHTPVCRLSSGFVWFEGDCDFIPMAREALPAWVRRASAAEAERDALRAERDLLARDLDAALDIMAANNLPLEEVLHRPLRRAVERAEAVRAAEVRGVRAALEDAARTIEDERACWVSRMSGHVMLDVLTALANHLRGIDPAGVAAGGPGEGRAC